MFCMRINSRVAFLKLIIVVFVCVKCVKLQAQLTSPCPRLFTYDLSTNEVGRWYGILTLLTDTDLNGIWLRIVLDRPALQLGNWLAPVSSKDNTEFLIKNRQLTLKAHTPQSLRFYVQYDTTEPVPQLASFRLNANTLCPENLPQGNSESTAELQTSPPNAQEPTPESPKEPYVSPKEPSDSATVPVDIPKEPVVTPENNLDPSAIIYPDEFDKFQGGSSSTTSKECGKVSMRVIPDGQATVEGEFPWHADLYYTKGIDLVYICSAVLISSNHLVSAAHCLMNKQRRKALNPDNFVVYLGKQYLRRRTNPGLQDHQASSIAIHPSYNPQELDNDIAIMKLVESSDTTDYVRPICLWQEPQDISMIVNRQGILTGWGYNASGKLSEQLTKARMSFVPSETCASSYQGSNYHFTPTSAFCTKFEKSTSTCVGDSGSGLALLNARSTSRQLEWQLRGIVGLSAALQSQGKCDTTQQVVFVDVAKHVDWIKQTMATLK